MAYSSITIEFLDFPPLDDVITLNESFLGLSMSETFKNLRSAPLETTVPTFDEYANRYIGYMSVNYKNAFNLDHNVSDLFTVTASTGFLYEGKGIVVITANYDGAVFTLSSSDFYSSDADNIAYTPPVVPGEDPEAPPVIALPTIVFPEAIVLSRSPFFISETPFVAFDEIRASLYIYRGDKAADKPIIANYSFSKKIVLALQPKISFDIHKVVNDYVKNNYNSIFGSGANTTSTLDTVWCFVDAEIYLDYTFKYRIQQQLLIVDGFGYTTELANPFINKKVLSSINDHVIYTGSDYPLYFITKDLVSITVNGSNVPFTYNQNFNNQKIGYVNISDYGSTGNFNAVFVYADETVTHSFSIKEECRFTVINCIFKNKFGFWQTIPFNKLSKKSIDFENSDYSGLIANYGEYSLNQHEKKSFLSNGKEKITVNTDFINENYNALFVELMLSEFVYLEENANVLPVNLLKKSFEKKTKLNNKLIQYSMDFEYSFKLMNTIL
jgi:hypothetical protein